MHIQYAKFVSLVLHDVHHNFPIFPFDSDNKIGNIPYHYFPSVSIQQLGGCLGYAVMHYEDQDSRRVCCVSCSDEVYSSFPDILTDAVEMGMAAWGGKTMTPAQALTLVQHLSPERDEEEPYIDGEGNEQTRT